MIYVLTGSIYMTNVKGGKVMNTNVLMMLFAVELLGIAIFSIVVYGIFGLTFDNVKESPKLQAIRKWARVCEHTILIVITVALFAWFISQFLFFGATVSSSIKDIIFSIIFILGCIVCYVGSQKNSALWLIFLQLVLCLVFVDIGTTSTKFERELVIENNIEYSGYEYRLENIDDNNSQYFDFYYCKLDSSIDDNLIIFSSRFYCIELVHDVEEGGQEYYQMYDRERITKLEGIGFYYNAKDKPDVVIHVK